jgi:hypothetical protein
MAQYSKRELGLMVDLSLFITNRIAKDYDFKREEIELIARATAAKVIDRLKSKEEIDAIISTCPHV